jgi:ribosome-associated protein
MSMQQAIPKVGLEPIEAARRAVEAASDRQASDVVLLDLRGLAAFTDFFVICSADSSRQISAILRAVQETLEGNGVRLGHREGAEDSGWVLMDFGDVIVHIFSPEEREHYDLESAWKRAPQLVRVP